MNKQIFRECDIRGIAESDFTPDLLQRFGRAFGSRVIRNGGKNITIGRDVRQTGRFFFDNIVEGLLSTGCNVIDLGIVPTPLLYFSQYQSDVDAGLMITGSHNPPEYNGIKIIIDKKTVWGTEIQKIAGEMEEGNFCIGFGKIQNSNIVEPYMNMMKEKVKFSRPIKVVIDSGNGCGGLVAPPLFRELGCDVIELFCEPDGNFPNHHPDPTIEENMEHLKQAVIDNQAELGIGYDGDADRIGIVDNNGKYLIGDQIIFIYIKEILERVRGVKMVIDIKCSKILVEYIKYYGGIPIWSPSGHSIIKENLNEEKAQFAGELSGHMFFADDYFGFDDAIYASVRMLQIIDRCKQPVSSLLNGVSDICITPEIRLNCPDERKFQIVDDVVDYFKKNFHVIEIDGGRINFGSGWGLIRASNTQPAIVLRFEAESTYFLEKYKNIVYRKLASYIPISR